MPAATFRDLKSLRFLDLNEHLALDSNIFLLTSPEISCQKSVKWKLDVLRFHLNGTRKEKKRRKFSTVNLFR